MTFSLFISCPKGLEYLLETELKTLGLIVNRVSPQGVYGDATLEVIYQLCLWSRLANRIQVILCQGSGHNQADLYQLCAGFPWDTVFSADKTFAIEFHGSSKAIQNTMFGAQVVKDAIVDYWRQSTGTRPTIARDRPDIRLQVYLKHDIATVSYDLTGYSLHQRGYRLETGFAPLKENIAAAMLLRANWPQLAQEGYAFHDPFCGSGTLVIEAAMMAAQIAPGLLRQDQSFHAWVQHDPHVWRQAQETARQEARTLNVQLLGSDSDSKAINMARANASRAGVNHLIELHCKPFETLTAASSTQGLLLCNPPYGERLGDKTQLIPFFRHFGQILHEHYSGWQAAVLSSESILAKAIGLRAHKQYSLYNGALPCKLYCFDLRQNRLRTNHTEEKPWSDGAQMFANRLRKNNDHLRKWVKRHGVNCYRIYDADLPEYAYAIDRYEDYIVLQEYAPPTTIPAHLAEKRRLEVLQVTPQILDIPMEQVIHKQRQQQKGQAQYQRLKTTRQRIIVQEGQAKFFINLQDYLDTGLFLDHRVMRLKFGQLPANTRFLNCFCYTATASVHAALAGAFTTNVDLSNNYLQWAVDNFKLNELDPSRHQFIQFDCLEWLQLTQDRFDVIFLDPPSFSNSKRMKTTLDVQRDHESLINNAMQLLNSDGILYFSTNLRRFKLSETITQRYQVADLSRSTIDEDFKRNERIHQCFKIVVRSQ